MGYKKSDAWHIGPSKIAGCGVLANRVIAAGDKVGVVWVKDPESFKKELGGMGDLLPRHFRPWFGRAVNHCGGGANSYLEEGKDGAVWTVASRTINPGEDIACGVKRPRYGYGSPLG